MFNRENLFSGTYLESDEYRSEQNPEEMFVQLKKVRF